VSNLASKYTGSTISTASIVYTTVYNTARLFPCFPLDGLAVYIVHMYGLFIYLHGSHVEPHPISAFDWL